MSSSALPEGPTLTFVQATETEITVEFTPVDGCSTYELSWKEYPAPWTAAKSTNVTTSNNSKTKVSAEALEPGTTYCVRLTAVANDGTKGPPGKEIILDTEQVGCTPTDKKSCCTIL